MRAAAGLVTSFAPMTMVTSVRLNSPLMSSISFIASYDDLGLGEQDVHVTGHPSGDRVDRVLDLDALVLEQRRHLLDRVLCLRHGETVAGHDDDLVGVRHLDRRVRRRRSP